MKNITAEKLLSVIKSSDIKDANFRDSLEISTNFKSKGADSIDIMDIFMLVEDEFNIRVPDNVMVDNILQLAKIINEPE